jgi:hypothetical protein
MKKTIRLTERDLSRIVRKTIREIDEGGEMESRSAMDVVNSYLEERGGTLGARTPEEIMSDLTELERAIRIEKQSLDVYNERPNPNLRSKDEYQMESRRYRRNRY